jgi:hypothetical protein
VPSAPEAVVAPPLPPKPDVAAPEANAAANTREVDVRTLFEQSQSTPGPSDASTSAPPADAAPTPPIDLLHSEAVDADVLDDDAFFATLRDAVHDDAPLGPRDDDSNSFFDQDADRSSFRDVFRRRR